MTAFTVPAALAARPASLPRLARIELLKLTSTRLTYGLLATSVGLTLLWTTLEASRAGTPNGPAALTGYAGQSAIVTGGVWGLIIAAAVFGLAGYVTAFAVGFSFMAARGDHLAIGAGTLTDWGIGHLVGAALL